MATPRSFSEVIDLWPTIADYARDLGEPYENARQWRLNDSIPGRAFAPTVDAAEGRRLDGVTLELLCGFAEEAHRRRRAEAG